MLYVQQGAGVNQKSTAAVETLQPKLQVLFMNILKIIWPVWGAIFSYYIALFLLYSKL